MKISSFGRRRFLQYASLSALAALASACGGAPAATTAPATAAPAATTAPATVAPAATTAPTVVAPAATGQENVVTYSDSGFSPATITIKVGDTVVFKNESSRGMRVASNPHPVHTDYPGFDSKNSVGNGESYSFAFDKAGSWGYHNHLNPGDGGTVVVQ